MQLRDALSLHGPRRDSAGNLVASVLAARVGVQDYAGYEVGKPELATVAVYRPEAEVFSRDSMRSFAGAPVTIEHPSENVTPANWKDHAVGEASEEIVRDGEAVRVPFLLRDAGGIAAVEAGKREISMGYTCDLFFEDGVAPDGTPYQAVQRNIRINHLAIVDRARGGPSLRIGDGKKAEPPKTIDEALRAVFAEMARGQGITVTEMLAAMPQAKIEETAAGVATKFMSAAAGTGIASKFGDTASASAATVTAALGMRADAARRLAEHRLQTAYLGDGVPPYREPVVLTAEQARQAHDAAVRAMRDRVGNAWRG